MILIALVTTLHFSFASLSAINDSAHQEVTDASVCLNSLPTTAETGNLVAITWTTTNEGTSILRDFDTSISVDSFLLTSQHVASAGANTSQVFQTVWNTSNLQAGNHIVTASVQTFPNETDLLDNTFSTQVELTTTQLSSSANDTDTASWFGRVIDLYDQYPAPYGGQGANMSSDMFWPQQQVELYADVAYNYWPVYNVDVVFEVRNNYAQVVALLTARTDAYGVAHTYYRLPWLRDRPENLFGVWTVTAAVDVAGIVINDTLEFCYDFMVEISTVTADKSEYDHGDSVIVTINYGSYAQQTYPVVFWVVIKDKLEVPITQASAYTTVGGAVFSQYKNGTVALTMHIPEHASTGIAQIYAGAYIALPTLGGSAWCPIYGLVNPFGYAWPIGSTLPYLTILAHDLQILGVTGSPQEVIQGDTVSIEVKVKNKGNSTETSTVRAYYGISLIQEISLVNLTAGSEQLLYSQWNTTNVPQGSYQIIATVDVVRGETNIEDNTYYDGFVSIISLQPQVARDVAITSLTATPTIAEARTPIAITASVKNLGNHSETFNVVFYANTSKIGTRTITLLEPDSDIMLSFIWGTSNVNAGKYTIWALADYLPEEANETNNLFTDGTVTLLQSSIEPPPPSFDWAALIPVFAIALIAALIILLLLGFLRRRRKKPSRSSYIIISHTHI